MAVVSDGRVALRLLRRPPPAHRWAPARRSRRPCRRGQGGGGRGGPSDDCYRGGDPGYYNEIYVDGHDPETIWSPQTNFDRSTDGGKTWAVVPMPGVHVDHHEIVFDSTDANHMIIGNDGGLYETFDNMKTWRHFTNLPLSQFYRVSTDNSRPFYNVCGGAQDNGSICGPSRTLKPRRHPHERLVQRRRRRRLPGSRRSRGPQHRLRAVAGGKSQPARSPYRAIGEHPPARRTTRPASSRERHRKSAAAVKPAGR